MADPKIRYDILANAEGEEDVRRLANELEKLDDAVDPAAAERARKLSEQLRDLGRQQEALQTFVALKRDTEAAGKALTDAQGAAQKLGRELSETEKPTRAQAGQLEKLRNNVRDAKNEVETKTRALESARGKLGEFGIATTELARTEVNLRDKLQDTRTEIGKLGQQGQAVQAFKDLGTATEQARLRFDAADQAVEAYRATLSTTEAPSRQQTQELGRLSEAARAAQLAFQEQSQAQAQAGAALRNAGVDVSRLTTAQGKLAPAQREVAKATQDATGAQTANIKSLDGMDAASNKATKTLGSMKLELAAAGAAVFGIQRVLGTAAEASAAFSTAIAEVSTLLDDTTDIDALGESVRALTREFGGSAPDQAKALYQIISAGASDAAQATELLAAANRLAIGGVTDVTTAADGLTSILNAYGAAAGTAEEVSDALFVAMRAGKTTVGELSGSIGQVAPLAAQAGVGLDQLLAATAALTKGGVTTSQSITQLRGIISGVIKPSSDAAKLAKELGLQFDVQALQAKGLAGFLEDVRVKTGGNTDVMARLFGQVEALGGVMALTGNQAASFTEILGGMENRAGSTEEAFAKLADTPAQSAARFKAALEDVQISLGQAVTAFTPLLESVTGAVNAFNGLPAPIKTATAGIGAATVALPALGLALLSVNKALVIARAGFVAKAAAATATVAPLAAATTGTVAMGVASAAAAPRIAAAGTALTFMARALTLVKAATGIGLVLGIAEVARSFFGARKEAEELGKATAEALAKPQETGAAQAVDQLAAATQRAASTAGSARANLEAQDKAARDAAKSLGVDLYKASNLVNESFKEQSDQLSALVKGLASLKRSGVDTGLAVKQALEKMISGAQNQTELDALRLRIESLGKAGVVSEAQVKTLMDTLTQRAKEATGEVDKLAEAYKRFGLSTQAELQKVADDSRGAWKLIREDATASIAAKQQAFIRYATDAIAANGGVVTSELQVEAAAQKVEIQADKTGKVIVQAMGQADKAVEKTTQKFNELGQQVNAAGEAVNQLAGSLSGISAPGVRGPGDGAGPSVLGPSKIGATGSSGFTGSAQITPPPGYTYSLFPERGSISAGTNQFGQPNPGYFVPIPGYRPPNANSSSAGAFGGFAGSADQRAGLPDPNVNIRPPAPAPAPTSGGVTVNVTIGGKVTTISAATQADADALIRALEDAYKAGGG